MLKEKLKNDCVSDFKKAGGDRQTGESILTFHSNGAAIAVSMSILYLTKAQKNNITLPLIRRRNFIYYHSHIFDFYFVLDWITFEKLIGISL
jgi:hypothetical protein